MLLLIALLTVTAASGAGAKAIIAFGTIALLVGLGATVIVARSITAPLTHAVHVAKQVAAGDLFEKIKAQTAGEMEELFGALGGMISSLKRMALNVRHSADAIVSATKEIAAGNNDLSQRTAEQSSSLEETAASMEELTSTVRQNAESCKRASQLAQSATVVAVKGGDVVNRLVATMNLVTESSRKIVDIIGVIDGIAFQTNILALNAAVEAARAGEQGRGFAVVAAEVRNLAQRSAEAAKEIKALIESSVANIDEGAKLVQEAGSTISETVAGVKEVSTIIGEIAAASDEQSAGIEQVNQAIIQMDAVTQQNAALVEEAAAAVGALEEQALHLSAAVRAFRIDERDGAAAAQALVKKAMLYLKQNGRAKAFAAYDDPEGGFVQGDLYIVAFDMNGKNLAHGADPTRRGQVLLDTQDADGKYFMRERVELAKERKSFWQDYKFLNPVTGEIEPKSCCCERVDDLIIGCGFYR